MEDFTAKPSLPLAHFALRLLALIIDSLVLIVLCLFGWLISFISLLPLVSNTPPGYLYGLLPSILFFLPLIVAILYYPVCWGSLGVGPGGRLLRLRIVQRDGSPIGFGKAGIRFLGSIVSGLVIGLGYLSAVFDPHQQTWHDKIASTYVVEESEDIPWGLVVLAILLLCMALVVICGILLIVMVAVS